MKKVKTVPSPELIQELKLATDTLINLCNKNGLAVGGFVFSGCVPIILYNFGNTKQAKAIEFYEKLVRLSDVKRSAGQVQFLMPSKPS